MKCGLSPTAASCAVVLSSRIKSRVSRAVSLCTCPTAGTVGTVGTSGSNNRGNYIPLQMVLCFRIIFSTLIPFAASAVTNFSSTSTEHNRNQSSPERIANCKPLGPSASRPLPAKLIQLLSRSFGAPRISIPSEHTGTTRTGNWTRIAVGNLTCRLKSRRTLTTTSNQTMANLA